jgi:hypothetical protein
VSGSPPKPETETALLTHARTGQWTWHRYVTTVPAVQPDHKYTDTATGRERVLAGGPVWQHIFESTETDPELRAQRVWGSEDSRREGEGAP